MGGEVYTAKYADTQCTTLILPIIAATTGTRLVSRDTIAIGLTPGGDEGVYLLAATR